MQTKRSKGQKRSGGPAPRQRVTGHVMARQSARRGPADAASSAGSCGRTRQRGSSRTRRSNYVSVAACKRFQYYQRSGTVQSPYASGKALSQPCEPAIMLIRAGATCTTSSQWPTDLLSQPRAQRTWTRTECRHAETRAAHSRYPLNGN